MSDDMTIAEVARLLARIERGQQEFREEMNSRLDRTVSSELYAVQHRATIDEIAGLKRKMAASQASAIEATSDLRDEIQTEKRERKTDRRWWVAAVGIPTCAIVLQHLIPILTT